MLGRSVWLAIGATSAVRLWVIWGSFFWQDDYVHIWTAWNAPPADLIAQNWNGHREPIGFAVQWLLARAAPQVWWPAALLLSVIAVATTVVFWLLVRRWGGVTPGTAAAAILFAAWPATMLPQQWLSAGLESVALLLLLVAGWLLGRPRRWTPVAVGLCAVLAWGFHERAAYFLPVLFAIAWLFDETGGPRYRGAATGWRANRASWVTLLVVTALALAVRIGDGIPGRSGGTSLPGAMWAAGPGSVLRSVLGWLPFDPEQRSVVPVGLGLWSLLVLAVWMMLLLVGLSLEPHRTVLLGGMVLAVFAVELLSFTLLRGGFAGSLLAGDPRFTLITGTLLLAGLGSYRNLARGVVPGALVLACLGGWSMWQIGRPDDPGREWLAAARQTPGDAALAATPSPPAMLAHFFFTTEPPVYELGTTRTLLQVGPQPYDFPRIAVDPLQVAQDASVGPLRFTPLLTDSRRQCGAVTPPVLDAGVRVVRMSLTGPAVVEGVPVRSGVVYVFPPPGEVAPVRVRGSCVDGVEVGVPGR